MGGAAAKKSAVAVAKVISPAGPLEHPSPAGSIGVLEASLQSQSGLEVSMSCQDISVAPDYSVEDSLELEKCDHVEIVQPSSPEPPPRELSKAAASTQPSLAPLKSAASVSTPTPIKSTMWQAPPASSNAVAASASAAPSASSPKVEKDDDDDYGHESFEDDDMSVPEESIMGGSDDDGSNNWDGNGST